jgi:hypothetical protein
MCWNKYNINTPLELVCLLQQYLLNNDKICFVLTKFKNQMRKSCELLWCILEPVNQHWSRFYVKLLSLETQAWYYFWAKKQKKTHLYGLLLALQFESLLFTNFCRPLWNSFYSTEPRTLTMHCTTLLSLIEIIKHISIVIWTIRVISKIFKHGEPQ